jgi:hypothetical protein
MNEVLTALVPNLRFGPVTHQRKSENFLSYYVSSTTSSTANDEFSIQHGLGRTPYLAVPVLPLDSSNAKTVRLEVTRPADAYRVYLRSPETSAKVTLLIE